MSVWQAFLQKQTQYREFRLNGQQFPCAREGQQLIMLRKTMHERDPPGQS